MLYFSIGYTEDSKDPTEEHINFACRPESEADREKRESQA